MTSDKRDKLNIEHDTLNEMVVVAAALVDADMRDYLLARVPNADAFADKEHRAIWAGMLQLSNRGQPFSIPTLSTTVKGVTAAQLNALVAAYPTPPANIGHHVENLQWDHAKLSTIEGALGTLLKLLRDGAPRTAVISAAEAVAPSFSRSGSTQFMRAGKALVDESMDQLDERVRTGVYPTGIEGLDVYLSGPKKGRPKLIPGFAPGLTTILTGSQGSGKSTVGCQFILGSIRQRRKVLCGAWEMGDAQTLTLLATLALGLSREQVSTGQIDAATRNRLYSAMKKVTKWVSFFDAPFAHDLRGSHTNDEALDILGQQINDSGCDIFYADLYERALPDGHPDRERRALFRQQKIAQRCKCHQILLAQVKTKELESRTNKRPTRDLIYGSQAWVDIADNIFGVYNPQLYDPDESSTMEILVLKQRWGTWPLATEFNWDGEHGALTHPREIKPNLLNRGESRDLFS